MRVVKSVAHIIARTRGIHAPTERPWWCGIETVSLTGQIPCGEISYDNTFSPAN